MYFLHEKMLWSSFVFLLQLLNELDVEKTATESLVVEVSDAADVVAVAADVAAAAFEQLVVKVMYLLNYCSFGSADAAVVAVIVEKFVFVVY